ncbi:hypothetical protein [Komagataeibacter sp. FNDCF1]|uniref:hypothetical protein n=1 Tax=Komagataeibacter sp. FNDCF1 TaxID=2878681 RepID=UPI001E289A9D|nr:hypothetical protein [Komagataeibacter sp. FNDCF1]MCE2565081.1 hypothetical protein [Komagataeibacter sp. FNDCF1]
MAVSMMKIWIWKEKAGMRLLPAAILAIGTLCATSWGAMPLARAADPDWIFANSGPGGQPMVLSHQGSLDVMFYRSASGTIGIAIHQRHGRYRNPKGVETAMVMIGKFTVALQTFLNGQKWDTAGGDLKPDTVPDMVMALKGAATGALIPFEHDPVPFSVQGAMAALNDLAQYARAHGESLPPPLEPAPAARPAPGVDIEKLAHHPYDTQHGRRLVLPQFDIAANCARAHIEMQDTDAECVGAEQKSQAALNTQWAGYDSDLKGACLSLVSDPGRLEKYQALLMCLSRYQDDRRQWQLVSGSSGSDVILPAKTGDAGDAQQPGPTPQAQPHQAGTLK